MDIIDWIQNWYKCQCNSDWEHSYGIKIDTTDNPGWSITIDLNETTMEEMIIEYKLIEQSVTDWYGISIKDSKYQAVGDPTKLKLLLEKFREIAEQHIEAN